MSLMVLLASSCIGLPHAEVSMATAVGRYLSPDAAMQAIAALDTDHSGKVERAEMEAFALSQGLTTEDVKAEFASLDTNGDGELEADEISNTLHDAKVSSKVPAVQSQKHSFAGEAAIAMKAPAVAAPPVLATVQNVGGLGSFKQETLELEAEQLAGKALAEVFTRTAAKALESRSHDLEQASKLEAAAKSLRGQTAEIRRTAAEQTMKAAQEAAAAVFRETEGEVKRLESEAAEAERQAANQRAQAKEAMQKALAAQATMSASFQQLNGQ